MSQAGMQGAALAAALSLMAPVGTAELTMVDPLAEIQKLQARLEKVEARNAVLERTIPKAPEAQDTAETPAAATALEEANQRTTEPIADDHISEKDKDESEFNYRGDVAVTLPGGEFGNGASFDDSFDSPMVIGQLEFESIELKRETVLAPGVSRAVVFAPLKPGVHRFFGEFHPQTAKGEIVVVDQGAACP